MKRPRLSIADAMRITLGIGVFLRWLQSNEHATVSAIIAPGILLLACLLMIAGQQRSPFLWGFSVFGWAYYALVFFFMNEIHARANSDAPPILVTSQAIDGMHGFFHPRCDCDPRGSCMQANTIEWPPDRITSRRIGHGAMALLLGGMGGSLFRSYAHHRFRRKNPTSAGGPEDAVDVTS